MIEVTMSGICKDCNCADFDVSKIRMFSNSVGEHTKLEVTCNHESACKRILEKCVVWNGEKWSEK